MPSSTRHIFRRGVLPALLAVLALGPLLAGCGEDRSNLIPKDTAATLLADLDKVHSLAASGQCFEAAKVAVEAQHEIESLGPDVDPELKRSLLDGVTQLQVFVNDPDKCTESETTPTDEEPLETEETAPEPEGTTGATGTTGSGQGATGDQGNTDEDQDSEQPQNNGNGSQQQPRPSNGGPSKPTGPPSNGPSTGPGGNGSGGTGSGETGSGGIGPG